MTDKGPLPSPPFFHNAPTGCQLSRRSSGKNHAVEDGWFTLALSRVYPKPSPLPDLRLVTEAIAWDDSWADVENKIQKTLRYLVNRVFRPQAPITKGGRGSQCAF